MQTLSAKTNVATISSSTGLQLGLMFFSSGEQSLGTDRYKFILDSATFADQHGFASIWVPERHFAARMRCIRAQKQSLWATNCPR